MSSGVALYSDGDMVVLNKTGLSPIGLHRMKVDGIWMADGVIESVHHISAPTAICYRPKKMSPFEYTVNFGGVGIKIIHESYLSLKKDVKK